MVRAVIQARMGSSRLRGKSLMPLAGIPLLKRVINTAVQLPFVDEVFVATSDWMEDDPIKAYCDYMDVKCTRGSQEDVLERFQKATEGLRAEDQVIRLTADNPFNRIEISTALFNRHIKGGYDYSCIEGLSHVVCEIIQVGALRQLNDGFFTLTKYDKEHVTPLFRTKQSTFKAQVEEPNFKGLQPDLEKALTIDRSEDRDRVERLILDLCLDQKEALDFENIYQWLRLNA